MTTTKQQTEASNNLLELITNGNQDGYELRNGYCLQLKHGLMGYFPAIYKDSKLRVITFDKPLILEVWKTLTPRQSKLDTFLFLVNHQTGICYIITDHNEIAQRATEPEEFLSRKRFDELLQKDPQPFEWQPGLISGDMSREEFVQTLLATAKE